jgi:D-alanine-D-alanine ligase-like ATP-grasp enzyme
MLKVCVLQPDYSTSDVDYKNYDPPRNLAPLLAEYKTDHVFLNKLTVYRQLRELKRKKYDVFVNLCEGYLDWSVPSIDVIHCLELLNLPYTGPNAVLYDPSKELMKYVAFCCGVNTPAYIKVTEDNLDEKISSALNFPFFIKPAKAGDSLGIDDDSLVNNETKLHERIKFLLKEYDEILVEEYIAGREFTVLVAASAGSDDCMVYTPLEFVFPEGKTFKTYSFKTSELHKECNVPCEDEELSKRLKDAASKIFREFNGVGYARLDFRVNDSQQIFFLEINFTCSVFYEDGYEGSADYILMNEPGGKKAFLEKIISEGICRHQQKQKKYFLQGNAISGYGIYANKNILKGEIIFQNEGKSHRIITKKYVDEHWNADQISVFRKYAWPVGNNVYALWEEDPSAWAPQNHSCDPNTTYDGLNVISLKKIKRGEELTLDYTSFLNDEMESFICNCGAPNCKKIIQGIHPASVIDLKKKQL